MSNGDEGKSTHLLDDNGAVVVVVVHRGAWKRLVAWRVLPRN